MDNKDGKKKESIDDILSDLNGLLNKMPSILDGIKMPDIKPVDFKEPPAQAPARQAPAPEPEPKKTEPPAFDAEKTVVIDSLSSLPQGAELPSSEPAPAAQPADTVQPVDLPAFAPDETVPSPEPVKPAAAGIPAEGTVRPEAAVPVEPEPETAALPQAGLVPGGDSTLSDLAIPDIDALMQITDASVVVPEPAPGAGQASLAPAAEPGTIVQPAAEPVSQEPPAQGPAAAAQPAADEPSEDDLAEFERQLSSATPQNGAGAAADAQPAEAAPAPEAEPFPVIEPSAEPAQTVELSPEPAAAPAAEASPVELNAGPSPALSGGVDIPMDPAIERPSMAQPEYQEAPQQPAIEPAAELSIGAADETVKLDASAGPAPEPELQAQLPGTPAEGTAPAEERPQGIQLEPAVNFGGASGEDTLQVAGAAKDIPQDPGLSVGFQAPEQGDATLVVAPPHSSGGDEDKTVVFQPSVGPGVANRAGLSDLENLAGLPVPEGIPEERVRPLMFIYSADDGALCANMLAELDAICQRSQATPMFVKRTGVKPFEPDMNANFLMQTVSDSGAVGLICVGDVPQEKIYEMENVFGSSGAYFRHYDRDSFNHTAMLDMLLEVILR